MNEQQETKKPEPIRAEYSGEVSSSKKPYVHLVHFHQVTGVRSHSSVKAKKDS